MSEVMRYAFSFGNPKRMYHYVEASDYDALLARVADLEKAIRDADAAIGRSEGIGLSSYMQQLQMDASIAVVDACLASADPGSQS